MSRLQPTVIAKLAAVRSGSGAPQDPSAFSHDGHPFVRAGSLSRLLDGDDEDQLEKILPDVARAHRLQLFPKGTVLFAKSGMSATKGYIYSLKEPAYIVSHLAALVPHDSRDSAFLRRALQRFPPTSLIKDQAYPSIRLADIEQMEILAPASVEGRGRIAAILDKADALRQKRKRALDLLDSVTQSIFFDLFGFSGDEISRWGKPVALADLADIGSGITKGRKLNGQTTREVRYLAVANVQDRRLDLSYVKTIEATENEIARYRLQKGDLLLTEGGDPDKLGRGTLWASEIAEAIHQNHIFRVRLKSNAVLPLFLNWLVSSPYGKRYFLGVAKQTTGIASINKTQLSQFPTVVPPIDLQRKFVRLAEAIATESQQLLSSTSNFKSLFSSLQNRAFAGEL